MFTITTPRTKTKIIELAPVILDRLGLKAKELKI